MSSAASSVLATTTTRKAGEHQEEEEDRIPHDFPSLDSLKTPEYTFLAGCHNGEVWFLRRSNRAAPGTKTKSLFLGTVVLNNSYHANVQLLLVENDVYVFVGLRKGSSSPVKLWRLKEAAISAANDFDIQEHDAGNATKLRGFARALFLPELDSFLLATALGTNKAHMFVWPRSALNLPPKCVGSFSLKRNCSTSCFFTTLKNDQGPPSYEITVVMSYDDEPMLAQTWSLTKLMDVLRSSEEKELVFEGKSAEAKTTNTLEDLKESAVTLRTRDEGMRRFTGWAEVTESNLQATPFADLFPSLLMDPESYEGEMDEAGIPHGKGTRAFLNEGVTYEGNWSHGSRHGHGTLRDYNSEEIVFVGEFHNGFKRGSGREVRPTEEYTGNFLDDKRQGFGRLVFKRASTNWGGGASLHVQEGDVFEGFFKNGRLHGCGKFESRSSTPAWTCLLEFKSGICTSKFWSSDGSSETTRDEKARPLRAPSTTSPRDFHYSGPCFCWICLESQPDSSSSAASGSFLACPKCGYVAHDACVASRAAPCPFHAEQPAKLSPRAALAARPSRSSSPNEELVDFELFESAPNNKHGSNLAGKKRPSSTSVLASSKPPKRVASGAATPSPPPRWTEEELDARRGEAAAAPIFAERVAEARHAKKDKLYEAERKQQFDGELSMRKSWRRADEAFVRTIGERAARLRAEETAAAAATFRRAALQGSDLRGASLEELSQRERVIQDFLVHLLTTAQGATGQ